MTLQLGSSWNVYLQFKMCVKCKIEVKWWENDMIDDEELQMQIMK